MKHWAPRLCHPNVVQFLGLWEDTDEEGASTEGLVMERLHHYIVSVSMYVSLPDVCIAT